MVEIRVSAGSWLMCCVSVDEISVPRLYHLQERGGDKHEIKEKSTTKEERLQQQELWISGSLLSIFRAFNSKCTSAASSSASRV